MPTVDFVCVRVQIAVQLAVRDVHADLPGVIFQEEHVLLHIASLDVQLLFRIRLLLQEGEEARTVIAHAVREMELRLLHLLRGQVGSEGKRSILLLLQHGPSTLG